MVGDIDIIDLATGISVVGDIDIIDLATGISVVGDIDIIDLATGICRSVGIRAFSLGQRGERDRGTRETLCCERLGWGGR